MAPVVGLGLWALLVAAWLIALGRATAPERRRTPWTRLGLRESASLGWAGLVWLSSTGRAHCEE
ncbi:hypothetical protein KLP28_07385 [Nocardioidaceae bacterium]|nr:hypothetical protein KLP28_07385 [Nocardioidaceae bacterium]